MPTTKLPRNFAARVRSVHHPPPQPQPHARPSPSASSPQKADNPGVAVAVTRGRRWNSRLQKFFLYPKVVHVSDPTAAVRAGDTIAVSWWPPLSRSRSTAHTVTQIVKAWGDGTEQRNPVWSEEERRAWRRERLLRYGTDAVKKGLVDGSFEIGEAGSIVDVAKRARDAERRAEERKAEQA